MTALRSLLFAFLFYPATALFVVGGMIGSLFGIGPMRAAVHGWAAAHEWLARFVLGIRFEVHGQFPDRPALIAVKHQAMYETIQFLRLVEKPIIVVKRELADIPMFGWMMRRYGVIPVEREAGAKALREMLTRARDAVATGRPIVIYPEGTRVRPGTQPPLRPGFAGLYRALGLPVVPVAMNSGRLWGHGLNKRAGTIIFQVGETIPPGLDRELIEARVREAINALES